MKSVQGLLIALVLGVAGATLNWFYLDQRSRDVEKVQFIGIKDGVTVRRGDPLREDQLVAVDIPRNAVGQLQNFAYYYKDRATVIGQSPKRQYGGGELLLRQDLKTPPAELKFAGADMRAIGIPVDTSAMVTSLVVPGNLVSFIVARPHATVGLPAPADGDGNDATPTPAPIPADAAAPKNEVIGPFKILSLGNRLGSAEVMAANHIPVQQENIMTIAVQVHGGELDPLFLKLWTRLQQTNFRQVGVLLHPPSEQQE